MTDPQPRPHAPAAGMSDVTGPVPDPTRLHPPGDEPPTAHAPARWSGSAAVPPPAPRRPKWTRPRPAPTETPAAVPRPATAPDDDWATTPAVDPWADQDTPWDFTAPPPPPAHHPPTRLDDPVPPPAGPPPTRIDAPAGPPPTRLDAPVRPSPAAPPPVIRTPAAPPPAAAPPTAPTTTPPPRRRPRRGRRLALAALLGVVCCCGIPGALAWPAARQYPVTATLPASIADLTLRDDTASRRTVDRLGQQFRAADATAGDAVAGVYADGNGKRVTVLGVTGLRISPEADVETQLQRLTTALTITGVSPYDLGETGAYERCGVGRLAGAGVVVCAWADHGSLATVLLTRRSRDESAELTGVLRSAVLTRG